MACQVFHSGLTKQQSNMLVSIQNKSLRIILGENYIGYEEACTLLLAETLSDRRYTLCLAFVRSAVKGGLHADIFSPANCSIVTRSDQTEGVTQNFVQLSPSLSFNNLQQEPKIVMISKTCICSLFVPL